ncbi:DUF4271 domain-containing protein [Ferruginibacter lapsinanis]|uniref:DUF4271 domain-containing protein n=1 Tax=Ferruginibacter lapsinanis TaxID=563172 RepID=UPI001E589F4E|nr:DUF4271 domain-containing protein [Ferruginibacter lapsinanis]UEG51153.1 DUF4271 domain-containing protein [Ferruginibacter lapsinanis]
MKQVVLFFLLFIAAPVFLFSQTADSSLIKQDTVLHDTISTNPINQFLAKNSLLNFTQDTILLTSGIKYKAKLDSFLAKNILVNHKSQSIALTALPKKIDNDQAIYFYLIAGMAFFLAFFKFSYARYFNNLFRVFFNTSLRQSQLTDQLLQAKLPSLFFNVFFVLSGGVYLYFLLYHFKWLGGSGLLFQLALCVLAIALIYTGKYLTIKFTGWLTGQREVTNTYIFVVFLINKILGIFLLPFITVIAFSTEALASSAVLISLLLVSLMLILRFVRSYGLLQNKLKVSRFHFLLYIAGVEIIPLLLIYKGLMVLLNKNL